MGTLYIEGIVKLIGGWIMYLAGMFCANQSWIAAGVLLFILSLADQIASRNEK